MNFGPSVELRTNPKHSFSPHVPFHSTLTVSPSLTTGLNSNEIMKSSRSMLATPHDLNAGIFSLLSFVSNVASSHRRVFSSREKFCRRIFSSNLFSLILIQNRRRTTFSRRKTKIKVGQRRSFSMKKFVSAR